MFDCILYNMLGDKYKCVFHYIKVCYSSSSTSVYFKCTNNQYNFKCTFVYLSCAHDRKIHNNLQLVHLQY